MHTSYVRYKSMDRQEGLTINRAICAEHHGQGILSAMQGFLTMLLLAAVVIVAAVLVPTASTRLVQNVAGSSPQLEFVAAVYSADVTTMRCALENGGNVDAADSSGTTPLMIAAHFDDDGPLLFLLSRGAQANLADLSGTTALMYAARADRPLLVRQLLAAGADPMLKNRAAQDALAIAHAYGSWQAADVLEGATLASDSVNP